MRRPSHYMLLCSVLLLATFSASGHLRLGATTARSRPQPVVVAAAPPTRILQETQLETRQETQQEMLTGSVFDALGSRIAGAEVASAAAAVRTDGDGRFSLQVPGNGGVALRIAADGHRPAFLRAWPQLHEALVADLEPAAPWDPRAEAPPPLGRGPMGEGYVRQSDGKPLAHALVFVAETLAQARTDEAGRYEIELPDAEAALLVHRADGGDGERGFAARTLIPRPTRASGRVPLPDLVAGAALSLRGTVRDDAGRPVASLPLQILGDGFVRTIASAIGGAFHLGGLLPGEYRVRTFPQRGALGVTRSLTLNATVTDCDLQLPVAVERRLQVVTDAGAPIARPIVVTSADGRRREVVQGDDEGFVQVRSVAADSSYDVRAGAGYRQLRVLRSPPEAEDRIVVAAP